MMPPPEHESDRVSRAIELYHFGKEVTEDVRAVISDDLLVEVQAGSDRIAYPYGNSAFGGSWWEDTKYKKISGALVFYRTSGLLFTTEHRYEMSAQILYTYAVNGMSVKLEAVRPLNFQDLPGWSLEVSIWTRQITPIEHVYGLPVARLHITTEFAWYGLWTDTPDALLHKYITLRGDRTSKYGGSKWLKTYS
jgi:hypothetical protein